MQSDIGKSDGIQSDLRIQWPKSSDFDPKSHESAHRIIKLKNGIDLQSSKNLTEQSLVYTAAVRGTHTSTTSDRCVGSHKQSRRELSRRACPRPDCN